MYIRTYITDDHGLLRTFVLAFPEATCVSINSLQEPKFKFYSSFQANLSVPFASTIDFLSTSFGPILQLSASNKLQSALTQLASFKMLSRFVIDEAHCISQVSRFAIVSASVALALVCYV